MTITADGRLMCGECLSKVISSVLQRATEKLPGAAAEGAFALEPGDQRVGTGCLLCGKGLLPLDSVCAQGDRLTHLICSQLAERLHYQ
jgi:hypothetical protein